MANGKNLLTIGYADQSHVAQPVGSHGHGNLKFIGPVPGVVYRGEPYDLRLVHIHHISEHRIDSDDAADWEVHLVHSQQGKSITESKLVIGILYHAQGKGNSRGGLEALNQFLSAEAAQGKSLRKLHTTSTHAINPLSFFPHAGGVADTENWFHYEGSLTSEPFSEDVAWFVMRDEIVAPQSIEYLKDFAEQEARPLQALDRRIVVRSFA